MVWRRPGLKIDSNLRAGPGRNFSARAHLYPGPSLKWQERWCVTVVDGAGKDGVYLSVGHTLVPHQNK